MANSIFSEQDMCVKAHYENELQLMEASEYREDPYFIFWTWVAELIVECFEVDERYPLTDVMGILMDKIKNSNKNCYDIFLKVERHSAEYDNYIQEYGISSKINACGEFYQHAFIQNDETKKEFIAMAFTEYIEFLAPYLFEEATNWVLTNMHDCFDNKDIDGIKEKYKKYISKYKSLRKHFQV